MSARPARPATPDRTSAARAAFAPGAPGTPRPGCAEQLARKEPIDRRRCPAETGGGLISAADGVGPCRR